MKPIWIIDDDRSIRWVLEKSLLREGIEFESFASADEALRVGLVNYVDIDLDGRLQWLLQRLLDKSPAAIRRGLYTLKTPQGMSFEQHMAFTESQIALFTLTDDAREGQLAFQEKRAPQWRS